VTLSPATSPAAYPGSQLRLAVPGQSFTVHSALENDGRLPIGSTRVRLDVPDGWKVSPAATTQIGQLPGGGRTTLSWVVTPAADAAPGVASVTATTDYSWTADTVHDVESSSSASVQVPSPAPSGTADLAHVDWLRATSGWMTPRVDGEVGGGPLRMNGTDYATGLGVASPSQVEYYVGGQCATVTATIGIDDATLFDSSGGTATFQVLADGNSRYDSGTIARPIPTTATADVSGAQVVTLQVGDAGDGGYNDRADWADVRVHCS
jgi:alpha-galactosidase